MTAMNVKEIYERHIKGLSPAEQLQLIELITREVAAATNKLRERSLLELEGMGAEIWQGIDAQEYVNELRKEWDQR